MRWWCVIAVLTGACTFDRSGLTVNDASGPGHDAVIDLPPGTDHALDGPPGAPDLPSLDTRAPDTRALDTRAPDTKAPDLPWADFQTQTIQTSQMTITPGNDFAYNIGYGGSWRILSAGGGFSGSFTMPGAGQYSLEVEHLTSASTSCPGGGYSPVTIEVNGTAVAEGWDPAMNNGGSHSMVTDTWTINTNAGQNSLKWTGAAGMCTHYWIKRVTIQ